MSTKHLVIIVLAMIIVVVGLATLATIKAKAEPKLTLTAGEFAAVRTAQVEVLQAQQNLSKSQVWIDLQNSQSDLNKVLNAIWDTRKLDRAQYAFCDGPITDPPGPNVNELLRQACSGLVKGELAIRALPKLPPSNPQPATK